jgi:hypothetical protein
MADSFHYALDEFEEDVALHGALSQQPNNGFCRALHGCQRSVGPFTMVLPAD